MTWQLRVTPDSICNSCDVLNILLVRWGHCGISSEHCSCDSCVDFRLVTTIVVISTIFVFNTCCLFFSQNWKYHPNMITNIICFRIIIWIWILFGLKISLTVNSNIIWFENSCSVLEQYRTIWNVSIGIRIPYYELTTAIMIVNQEWGGESGSGKGGKSSEMDWRQMEKWWQVSDCDFKSFIYLYIWMVLHI